MKKRVLSVVLTISLIITGVRLTQLTPKADELEIEISDEAVEEQNIEEDTQIEDSDTVDDPEIAEDEVSEGGSGDDEDESDISAPVKPGRSSDDSVVVYDYPADDSYYGDDEEDMGSDEGEIDITEVVPDEPDNVVDASEDDFYEGDEEVVYDDKPFDASYITGEGVDRIRKVIIAYAESLGGTFRSPYYKGGQAVSIQCCAYVNQVWKHVFGKDIYDPGIMTTMSHENETIYGFLERTGAKAGDILYVRYWKVKKNDWSSHFMILLDYDRTGVYVTDGYETDEGKFVVWRINKKAIYSESNFFKRTGSDKDRPRSKHYSGKEGSFFKLYRMRQPEWCAVANSSYDGYASDPMVKSVQVRPNMLEGSYKIQALIYSSNGLDRVQFPAWTAAEGQDDLLPYYETDEAASGEIEALENDTYLVTYTVNIADHNNENGNYMTEMYMYDNAGVLMTKQLDAVNMDGALGGICVDHIPWTLE